jgi:hypothetical protein
MHTDIHASSGIRSHDPSVWAGEELHALDWAATVIGSYKVGKDYFVLVLK